jgi:hypothetical protein
MERLSTVEIDFTADDHQGDEASSNVERPTGSHAPMGQFAHLPQYPRRAGCHSYRHKSVTMGLFYGLFALSVSLSFSVLGGKLWAGS